MFSSQPAGAPHTPSNGCQGNRFAVRHAVMATIEDLGVRASAEQVNMLMSVNLMAARIELGGVEGNGDAKRF